MSVRKSCSGKKNQKPVQGGGEINQLNRKVSLCAHTALDVGWAEALLKLFGGEF